MINIFFVLLPIKKLEQMNERWRRVEVSHLSFANNTLLCYDVNKENLEYLN